MVCIVHLHGLYILATWYVPSCLFTWFVLVTDMGTKMCMDPGGNGTITYVGGEGGPGRLGSEEVSS